MATITTIDPVTRLEGHLKIQVTVDVVNGVQQVISARATGTLFRGFENLLINRHPWDAQHITQRICGVCPVSHTMAAVMAQENACGIRPTANGRIMRNLVLGANFIQSHILHFYHLAALDFVNGPNMPPWQPSWPVDRRLSQAGNDRLVGNYVKALEMRRKAHEMGAIFGGRLPAPPSFVPGGITAQPTTARIAQFRTYLKELVDFIGSTYLPDVQFLGSAYPDYASIGGGYGHLLAFGVFQLDNGDANRLLKRGVLLRGATKPIAMDTSKIMEQVNYSWYADASKLRPGNGVTVPQYPKGDAYSWLKAPRYQDKPMEVGPLARMNITDGKRRGVSVLARHIARAEEALLIAQAMTPWLDELQPGASVVADSVIPTTNVNTTGMTEAPRGALGHWLQLSGGKISRYQIVTPTCWNASPRDAYNQPGPIERALIGTPVEDVAKPIEVMRVIHSFDPCLSCAVHVARPNEGAKIFSVPHFHGGDEITTHDHDHDHGHTHSHSHDDGHHHDHTH